MKKLTTLAALGLTGLAWACAFAAPPATSVRDVVDTWHGTAVHDPYRWLENSKDPEVQSWMKAQGDYARTTLDAIPDHDAILKRIVALTSATGDAIGDVVRMPGNKTFFMRRAKGDKQFKLVLREAGKDRVLVDPQLEQDRTGVPHAVNWFVPSWDAKYVAYGLSAGGSEQASLYIMDAKTGQRVGQPIPRVNEGLVSWLPDSKSITYNQLRQLTAEDPESEFYLDSKVMWLKLGAPESEAKAVFGPTVTRQLGLVRLDVAGITFSPDSQWMIARTTDTTQPEGSLFVARVSELGQGESVWRQISKFDDKIVELDLKGDTLFYRTHKDTPRYKVMQLDLRDPQLAKAKPAALPPEGGVLEGFQVGAHELVAQVREGTNIALRRYGPQDPKGKAIPLPLKGAALLMADPARAYGDTMYRLMSWTQPQQILRVSANGKTVDAGLATARKPAGVPELEITDVKCTSWDGVQVPMTILHRKGLKRDGANPTLLIGYGSYGISETAYFDPSAYAWFERGGVIAHANVRGSGVYGDTWRYAGFKSTKSNTWKDGVACAQYLIAQGYASPATMSGLGGSAGGIFVGRMVTTAPQLFAAAVSEVGDMDELRGQDTANGITNISEFGDAKNPKEFPAALDMSTYYQIKDGTPYPAMLFVHGLNDPRVDVWHSAKGAARFQAASASGKPVLLRLDAQAGHGIGSTVTQRQQVRADIYSFLLWQMGKLAAH